LGETWYNILIELACMLFLRSRIPGQISTIITRLTVLLVSNILFHYIIHGVHCTDLSDFSVRGDMRRHISRQVAQLFRKKFRP
jgi:hypothetical protein